MTPKASFVIPAYNADAYLAQTLLSCRNQSVKEIEIIVVDNGSTDGTKDLVLWHSEHDPRVKWLESPTQKNRSAARNFGNLAAQAPIIFVMDSDDISLKNRVRDSLIHFSMKNTDVLYGPCQVIDENDNLLGNHPAGPFNRELAIKKRMNYIVHSTMAYRKGVTLNVQYDEGDYSRLGLDDWKFQWDCLSKGYKFGFTKTFLTRNRIYGLAQSQDKMIFGSETEEKRDAKEVEALKSAYLAGIAGACATEV